MIPACDGQTVGRSDGQTVGQTESIIAKTALCVASYADALSKTDRDCCYRSLLEIVFPQFGKYYPPPSASGNISQTSGKQFPMVTSTPVTICILVLRELRSLYLKFA